MSFSIHASAKEATRFLLAYIIDYHFQSTPPRRRRPVAEDAPQFPVAFSIHASAKEATSSGNLQILMIFVFSIHASAKEATKFQ